MLHRKKCALVAPSARARHGFTLVELLVVIGIISVLIGVLLPTLSRSRKTASKLQCLSNLRQLETAQVMYAAEQKNLLIYAGDGTEQGSWIGALQPYSKLPLARRCPDDKSIYFDTPIDGSNPAKYRLSSYGINNYLSPTHTPAGTIPLKKITQAKKSSSLLHFSELAESGSAAAGDHIHGNKFFPVVAPDTVLTLIATQMVMGRHGGHPGQWDGVVNASFLDGHAESLPIRDLYESPEKNRFDPAVAK